MSEFQYYEFQAVDRPLDEADHQALRALSTRARITATSFTNVYEWGDFKGDPATLMERWFDLHLYLANWRARRLMIRLPKRLADQQRLKAFLCKTDCAVLRASGENLILDIAQDEVELDGDWDDGSGWLAALAPLRADMLAGDLRLCYLLWLTAVEANTVEADDPEPMSGIGPVTGALEAFTAFFGIDPYLVQAAAEHSVGVSAASPDAVLRAIAAMAGHEKTGMLMRLFGGDPLLASEFRATIRERLAPAPNASPVAARTAGELRARARSIRLARERAQAGKAAAELRRQEEQAEKARRARLDAIARRGEGVWGEIETEIGRRNAAGYDRAASLLHELRIIAGEQGASEDFASRLCTIRERHARKERFIERLTAIR
ncbi:MAG: hypothetical protein Q7N95_17945 [Alphaproteobacteria bacterium]|nr:hypothetical protein [Alphaproteobacteria bacterium]